MGVKQEALVGKARQGLSYAFSGFLALMAMILRPISGLLISVFGGIFNVARNLFGVFVAGVGEGLNAIRNFVGVIFAVVAEVFELALRAFTGVVAVIVDLVLHVPVLIMGVFAEGLKALHWLLSFSVAVVFELLNMVRHLIGVVIAAMFEVGVFVWYGLSLCAGVIFELLDFARNAFGWVLGLGIEALALLCILVIQVVAVVLELPRALWAMVGLVLGFFAESFTIFWKLMGVGFAFCAEFLNGLRTFLGVCLGLIFAFVDFLVRGVEKAGETYVFISRNLIFGREYHFGSFFNQVISSPIFGEQYQLGETMWSVSQNHVFGSESWINKVVRVYKDINELYHPGVVLKFVNNVVVFLMFGDEAWGKSFGKTYTDVKALMFPSNYSWGSVFMSVNRSGLFGAEPWLKQLGSTYTQIKNGMFDARYLWGGNFRSVSEFFYGTTSLTTRLQKICTDVFNSQWLFRGPYVFGRTYSLMNSNVVFGEKSWRTEQWGETYAWLNYSQMFGNIPWRDQSVASDLFEYFAGYPVNAGLSAWVQQTKQDFTTLNQNMNKVLTILSGVGQGLVVLPFNLVFMMAAGAIGGLYKSGLIGGLVNVLYGVYRALSYPFHYAQYNLAQVSDTAPNEKQNAVCLLDEASIEAAVSTQGGFLDKFPVWRDDLAAVWSGEFVNWRDPKPVAAEINGTSTARIVNVIGANLNDSKTHNAPEQYPPLFANSVDASGEKSSALEHKNNDPGCDGIYGQNILP